jgi:hypothetical protein
VRRRASGEPAKVGFGSGEPAEVDFGSGQRRLGAEGGHVGQQPGGVGAVQLRYLGEPGPRRVAELTGGHRVTGRQRGPRSIEERSYVDRVDAELVGRYPVAAGHRDHRQAQAPNPGDERLDSAGGVPRRVAVPDRVDERGGRHRPSTGVDQRPDECDQALTADQPAVDGERAERRDLHRSSIA